MFRPEEMVILCPPESASDKVLRESLHKYFEYRGCPVKITVVPVSLLDAAKVEKQLQKVLETHEDCAIDISGGTDASLFAAGAVCGTTPVFTYSGKRNSFFEIQNAPFARSLPCTVRLDAASCFLMAGGVLLPGREDNRLLRDRLPDIDKAFAVYSAYRTIWERQVKAIQRISSSSDPELRAEGPREVKVDSGHVAMSGPFLHDLEKAGLIRGLRLTEEETAFSFADEVVRFWLRDIGAVLELAVYKACLEAGCFDDVVLSAVVNWRSADGKRDTVTNEIDVMAVRGVQPMFISCKTCEIRTEALNELAVLRDRFGGQMARAAIVTAERANVRARSRASELNIHVIDLLDLEADKLQARLKRIMNV
jgi:hypothetical protein